MQETLEKFFEYLDEENFEEGSTYMAQSKGDAKELSSFCSDFLMAKHIVEISYSYTQAKTLYSSAAQSVVSMNLKIFASLAEFALMQRAILRIDRGIYTAYAPLMSIAAQELKEKTESILELLSKENQDDVCYRVLQENLVAKVTEDNIYANAILIVADLYLKRWSVNKDLDEKIALVKKAVRELENAGNERLASDLAPHIHVIKRFEDRRANEGKLFIENGEVAFYYYSTLDYRIREEFNDALQKRTDETSVEFKELQAVLDSTQMVSEEMTDIWSGLASIEFIDTYKFILNSMKIKGFREIETLEADVELKYYTMGVFEIKVSFLIDKDYLEQDPEGLSLSGLRHLQSLGTPFSLDEKILIENIDEEYSYLAEYADTKFEKLSEGILELLKKSPDIALLPEKQALTHNTEQNHFTLVRINKIVEHFPSSVERLRSQDFEKHFQFKALVMPVREVRSAIDNWIMYDSEVIDTNMAGIRYNESEWLSINLHQGVVALLEQPVWVFDQAIESIEVSSAVFNLLNLSNIQAAIQIKNLSKKREDIDVSLKGKELKGLRVRLESEIEQLDEFKSHISNLLETVEAGSMMTYPDHTIFMERLFGTIDLERQKKKTIFLQEQLKEKRSKGMETIKKINEAVAFSQQKMIKLVVSIASVFIALGSLTDMFELWSDSKTIQSIGFADSDGDFKLYFVLSLAVIATFWLVYDNYLRDKKE